MDRIEAMREYGNLEGLLQLLRQKDDPTARIRAARALGQLGELEAAGALTGASLNDPDPEVRQAARLALHDLLGDQAELVLSLEEVSGERDENWLNSSGVGGAAGIQEEEPGGFTDYETLRGLIMIARGDPNRELRLRAAQSLGHKSDMTAIRALAELALWDEDEGIRATAENTLSARFGEKLPDVLEGYRREMMGEEDEFGEYEPYSPYASQPDTSSSWDAAPARKEEAASGIGCLLLVFLFFAALYLILR